MEFSNIEYPNCFTHNSIKLIAAEELFTFYQTINLIPMMIRCPNCSLPIINSYLNCSVCLNTFSNFSGTIFHGLKIKLNVFHFILISYLERQSITTTFHQLEFSEISISKKTISRSFAKIRSKICDFMDVFLENVVFDGTGQKTWSSRKNSNEFNMGFWNS